MLPLPHRFNPEGRKRTYFYLQVIQHRSKTLRIHFLKGKMLRIGS